MHVLILRGAASEGAAIGEDSVRLCEEGQSNERLVLAREDLSLTSDRANVDRVLEVEAAEAVRLLRCPARRTIV